MTYNSYLYINGFGHFFQLYLYGYRVVFIIHRERQILFKMLSWRFLKIIIAFIWFSVSWFGVLLCFMKIFRYERRTEYFGEDRYALFPNNIKLFVHFESSKSKFRDHILTLSIFTTSCLVLYKFIYLLRILPLHCNTSYISYLARTRFC